MTSLKRAGESGALNIAASIAQFQEQIAAVADMLRQLGGNARVVAGALAQADPLSSPFTLYVNPYIGSDRFVGGAYNSFEEGTTDEEIIASKLKRIELQRLECGYTPYRPFKTINRAVIEAAIITSKDWYTYTDPRAHVDCVSIVLAPGVHILYNDPGSSSTSLVSWGESKDPSIADLIAFNPASVGGVLLPRGCSLCGPDLRKTTIRPTWVPGVADEASDYSNRRGMLKITGTGYFFGFTVMDKVGENRSHHLLDPFHFASKAELDAFYAKCFSAVGTGADLGSALTVTRPTEHEIVGPIDAGQNPTSAWDTTSSASPYIFNCSVRSNYGMCGAFMDGAKVGGLKSMVCANFTGVSLQKDMTCWQVYEGGNWVNLANTPTDYQKYIDTSPDNVRMNPARLSRHIQAINDAFIQEVSVFAIGHGIHHFTDLGGEITVTNSNSSFGGCAALSRGYKTLAFPQDRNWTVGRVRVPLNLSEKIGNIRRIFLGTISAISGSKITLTVPLATDETSTTVPAILLRDNYSLRDGTRIWVENPTGDHWRSTLTSSAWSSTAADEINIITALTQSGTNDPVGVNPETGESLAIGKRVYVRRLVDTRTPSERRLTLQLNNTASARLPERNFVLQTDPARVGGAIIRALAPSGSEVLLVSDTGVGATPGSGVAKTAEITIRRGAPSITYANGTFYRAGTIVRHANKHYQSLRDQTTETASPSPLTWGETFVHMPSAYNAEDLQRNQAPILTIDTDTDANANSTTLGIDWSTIWTSAGPVLDQYRSATDYLGAHAFLVALGFTSSAAHSALVPQVAADRDRDPSSSIDFPAAPLGGAANGRGNWALEFRRPSVLRLYGHAWEWAGYLNYSKSIPAAQKDLAPQNKFTYYFTHEAGGRVVPQGSNEDGFNVSPKGLEDIETGATLTVDSIGSSTLDDFQSTDFPNGLTASEITVDTLTINTSVQFPEVSSAKVDSLGPVRLASISQITASGLNAVVAGSDGDIEGAPEVVTIGALNRWRIEQRLLSQRTGVQAVYVDPVNGADTTNLDTLLGTPPTSSENRIKSFIAAVNYANAAFSPQEIVEFRLGPGIYPEVGTITFKSITRIRAWSYAGGGAYLNDHTDGGTIPFNSVNFYDPTKQPVFLSRATSDIFQSPQVLIVRIVPLRFVFEQDAEITGVAWWGPMTTISNAEVPDSLWPGTTASTIAASSATAGNWRDSAITDPDNSLNYFIRSHAMLTLPFAGQFFGIRQLTVMDFKGEATMTNVAIGAMAPADFGIVGGGENIVGLIRIDTNKLIRVRGLRLVGNVKVSSEVNTGSFAAVRLRSTGELAGAYSLSSYFVNGHSTVLFMAATAAADISVVFDGILATEGEDGTYSRNYDAPFNNVSLLNSQNPPVIATATDSPNTSNWKNQGPAFHSIYDRFGTFLNPVAYNWIDRWVRTSDGNPPSYGVNVTGSPGFAGVFGNYQLSANATANLRTTGMSPSVPDSWTSTLTKFGLGTYSTIFRVARTGEIPANVTTGLGNGEVGAYVDFDLLNIRVRTVNRGVDTSNAMTAIETVTL